MSTNYRLILRNIIEEYYAQFKNQTRKCLWLSAFVPSEIVKCFDVDIFYPESYTAVLAVRNINSELMAKGESLGFNESICSYMRIFEGALEFGGNLPYGKIPKPDALIVSNNQCGTLHLMWGLLANRYNIPLFIIDFPSNSDQKELEEYITTQLKELIHFIETITDSQFEFSKLKEHIINSSKISNLWKELCEGVFMEKLPISIHTLTNNFFFPIVCAHSDIKTLKFLEASIKSLKEQNQKDKRSYRRLYWWGYPFWFSNDKFPNLLEYGGKIVVNNYLLWWCIPINIEEPLLKNLSKAYLDTYLNRGLQRKINDFEKDIKIYNIDGVIIHTNSSCKRDSISSKKVARLIKNIGIPTIEIEGDMCDINKYQKFKSSLKIEAFLENI